MCFGVTQTLLRKINHETYMIKTMFQVSQHYNNVIMSTIASQITSLTIVYSIAYSGADQRKHQSSASLAFVRGVHRWPVNSPHKWPVTRKMFPFDDVIMVYPTINWNLRIGHQVLSHHGRLVTRGSAGRVCQYSGNTWLCVHWQWNTREWCH